ncbi:MAG: O-antigen ligase family protein [Deltaproteobacteria bacterium]|nr:O-antigen ligase family protein [Deltaproteobacteria bacterium]
MLILTYIIFICYIPIIGGFFPRMPLGLNSTWLFFYLLALAFIIDSLIKQDVKFRNKWIFFLAIYSLVVFASISWTPHYSYCQSDIRRLFVTIFVPLFIAFVAINLFRQEPNVRLYIKNIIIASFILSLIAIYQWINGIPSPDSIKYGLQELRVSATFANPNGLAIFLVLTIPCIIYGIEKNVISKIFGWLVVPAVMVGIICTVSRKGIITMIIAFLLYYVLKKQFKRVAVLSVALAVLVVIIAGFPAISDRFASDKMHADVEGKKVMTLAGWDMFLSSPIRGLGYNGYYEHFGEYFPWYSEKKYQAHNMYITVLADQGLAGFVPFMLIFLYPLFISAKILREKSEMPDKEYSKDMAVICISSVVPFMMSGYYAGGLLYSQIIVSVLYTHITFVLAANIEEEVEGT